MADQPKPKEERFKVVDRRHFTSEGERRKDILEEEAARGAESTTGEAKPEAGPASTPPRQEVPKGTAPKASLEFESPPGTSSAADFSALVGSFYRSALALLGAFADPETGHAIVDLEGARHVIDLLEVLAEKTSGNLTQNEATMLGEVKAELKLAYLNVAQATAQAVRERGKTQS